MRTKVIGCLFAAVAVPIVLAPVAGAEVQGVSGAEVQAQSILDVPTGSATGSAAGLLRALYCATHFPDPVNCGTW